MVSETVSESSRLRSAHFFDAFLKAQREGYAQVHAGQDAGIQLPWLAAQAYLSRLKWAEMTMLMGPSGSGKTTFGVDIAEHTAWKQKLNCDVVMIRTETDPEVIQRRRFSRHSLIPFKVLDSFALDLDSEKWKPKVEAYENMLNENSELRGHIHLLWMPEAEVEEVVLWMERCVHVSAAMGRRVMFVIDYLQGFNWWKYGYKQNIAYELIGMRLAGANRTLKTHTILIAQEGDNEGEAFGSKMPRKISQLVLTIRREKFDNPATDNGPPIKVNGVEQKDALGNTRYMFRKGDQWGPLVELGMSKANDAAPGVIRLYLEGALNLLHQDKEQIKALRDARLLPPENMKG